MLSKDVVIGGEISLDVLIDGNVTTSVTADGSESTVMAYEPHGHEPYAGTYEVTPSDTEQVLSTAEKVLSEDIVVHAIPSNYGRIEWNGAVLTVS